MLASAYRHDRLAGKAGDDALHGDHLTGRGHTGGDDVLDDGGGDDRIDLAAFTGGSITGAADPLKK